MKDNKFSKFIKKHGKMILITTGVGVAGFICGHRYGLNRYLKRLTDFVGDEGNICLDSIDLCGRTMKDVFTDSEIIKATELYGCLPEDEVIRVVACIKQ